MMKDRRVYGDNTVVLGHGEDTGGDEFLVVTDNGGYLVFQSWGQDYGSGIYPPVFLTPGEYSEFIDIEREYNASEYLRKKREGKNGSR